MLNIPEKKILIARALRYAGFALVIVLCVLSYISEYSLWFWAVLVVGLVMAFSGQEWTRSLYKCPKCESKLLPWRSRGGLEKSCPEYCVRNTLNI